MKLCRSCDTEKPFSEFTVDRSKKDGRSHHCVDCAREYRAANADRIKAQKKARYDANPEPVRERARAYYAANAERVKAQKREAGNLKIRYGLTKEDYSRMLAEQGGKCANPQCGNTPLDIGRRLHVDHDHSCCPGWKSCGKCVRGLLCPSCNSALGYVDDDIDRLNGLTQYLKSRGSISHNEDSKNV